MTHKAVQSVPGIAIAAISLIVGLALASTTQSRELAVDPEDMIEVELASVGMDPLTRTPLVLLRALESSEILPIVIGVNEAQAILFALHDQELPRPMTHDLMTNLIEKSGLTLERVLIDQLTDNTFYGMLELSRDGDDEVLLVDTRPSDGMALAVRTGARILVAPDVLEAGRDQDYQPLDQDQVAAALGLRVVEISADIRESLDLPDEPGVIVTQATGQAAEAGITAGAMLLRLNDQPVDSPMQFLELLQELGAGDEVRIHYWYEGAEHDAKLDMRPPERPRPDDDDDDMIRA